MEDGAMERPWFDRTASFPSISSLQSMFGISSEKRNNVHVIDEQRIIYAAGNTARILNLETGHVDVVLGKDIGGVGSVAVHPSRQYFAIGGIGDRPNVLIYRVEDLSVHRVLRDGTERAFADLAFNSNGDKIATLGSSPDYMLAVWDWEEELIVLRSKAFGQDVFRVSFSPTNDGILTTSGLGHIRFWKMAQTFTGLKLQGEIGKFGRVEISDVYGYAELPDGKVLSGSESGSLLLWEGNLIKCEICTESGNCHTGECGNVFLMEDDIDSRHGLEAQPGQVLSNLVFISGGADGYVRYWNFDAIDIAELSETESHFVCNPLRTFKLGNGICIMNMTKLDQHAQWLVQDVHGGLWKADLTEADAAGNVPLTNVLESHGDRGGVTGVCASPAHHIAASVGVDGSVRLLDYRSEKILRCKIFDSPASYAFWPGLNVDPSGQTFLVGFENGVVRIFRMFQDDFELLEAHKPHSQAITNAMYSPDAKTLITCSLDGTIFFFDVPLQYAPIGFINVGEPCTCLLWRNSETYGPSPDGDASRPSILVGTRAGHIFQYGVPLLSEVDNSETYELHRPGLEFHFQSKITVPIKTKLRKKRKKEDEADGSSSARSNSESKDKEASASKPTEDEDEWETDTSASEELPPPVDTSVKPILQMMNSPSGSLIVALDYRGGVFEFEAKTFTQISCDIPPLEGEEPLCALIPPHIVPSTMCLSSKESFFVIGDRRGMITEHRVPLLPARRKQYDRRGNEIALPPEDDSRAGRYVLDFNVDAFGLAYSFAHGGFAPRVRHACSSFDEAYIISGSADGIVSAIRIEIIEESPGESLPSGKAVDEEEQRLRDITEKSAYSIQEAKLKAEQDNREKQAERKKNMIRETIRSLRERFKSLLVRNRDMPDYFQLPRDQFEIDPVMTEKIHQENEEKLYIARKEQEWESEKCSLGLHKLKSFFLDSLAVERILLRGFQNGRVVSSFRTRELSEELQRHVRFVHELIQAEESRRRWNDESMMYSEEDSSQNNEFIRADEEENHTKDHANYASSSGHLKASHGGERNPKNVQSAMAKAEHRRQIREEFRSKYEQLEMRRPSDDYEDPRDSAAILYAERNTGEFSLKSDPKYKVPDHLRVNAEKKLRQMVLLEESIFTLKMDFNERFLALRDLKSRMIGHIKEDLEEIERISKELSIPPDPPIVDLQEYPDEFPERRAEYTREDLIHFGRSVLKDSLIYAEPNENVHDRDSDVPSSSRTDNTEVSETTPIPAPTISHQLSRANTTSWKASAAKAKRGAKKDLNRLEKIEEERRLRLISLEASDLEDVERTIRQATLLNRRLRLTNKIQRTISTFDTALDELYVEKLKLEADLKTTDLKMLLLYRELCLLRDLEKSDRDLADQFERQRQNKVDIIAKMASCDERLLEKKQQLEEILQNERGILSSMNEVVSQFEERADLKDVLWKIFRKKVNRRSDSDGNDDDSMDFDDDGDFGDDEDEGEDEYPEDIPQSVIDRVHSLRESRVDEEERLAEFYQGMQMLKKEHDDLVKREATIDEKLSETEDRISEFQKQKQGKLNELFVLVPLKLDQIQNLQGQRFPLYALDDSVVFTRNSLLRMSKRIDDLQLEKNDLRKLYRQLRKEHKLNLEVYEDKAKQVESIEAKVKEVQLMRFGKEVNIEDLDRAELDSGAEEVRREIATLEQSHLRELRQYDEHIIQLKMDLSDSMRDNTTKLEQLAEMQQKLHELENDLQANEKSVLNRLDGESRSYRTDRDELKKEVLEKAQDMERMRTEISMLRRKTGHIYVPVASQGGH